MMHRSPRLKTLVFLSLLPLASTSLPAQGGGVQIANITQDIGVLRDQLNEARQEVQRLQAENEQMRARLEALEKRDGTAAATNVTQADLTRAIDMLKLELRNAAVQDQRALVEQLNAKLGQISAGTTSTSSAKTGGGTDGKAGTSPAPGGKTADEFPKTGIAYIVQPGDTISGIARKLGSRTEWIMSANRITNPAKELRVGRSIFIPQQQKPQE